MDLKSRMTALARVLVPRPLRPALRRAHAATRRWARRYVQGGRRLAAPWRALARRLRRRARFVRQFRHFRARSEELGRGPVRWRDRRAVLGEAQGATGFDPQYFYHLAWAARVLAATRPDEHVDVSSSTRFASMISAFVPVKFYDFHPPAAELDGLQVGRADLADLPFADGSVASLSCMHVVEHVGLGRYGDPLDPDGDRKAMAELRRVLAPGGQLLLVAPVGRPRVLFNAHRVYAFDSIREAFADLELAEFALIPGGKETGLIRNADPARVADERYACGCFRFVAPGGAGAAPATKSAAAAPPDPNADQDPLPPGKRNQARRERWIAEALGALPAGLRILDAGAGEQVHRKLCGHLDYVAQDFAQYDGAGDGVGLQPGDWQYGRLDIVCDITDIPEPDASFDAVLCTEVLEHLPDVHAAMREFARLVKPGGALILTAPFCSLTHQSPYHFASGFGRAFYETVLPRCGFEIASIESNGGYFEYIEQELSRAPKVARTYAGLKPTKDVRADLRGLRAWLRECGAADQGSDELLCFGFMVRAVRKP